MLLEPAEVVPSFSEFVELDEDDDEEEDDCELPEPEDVLEDDALQARFAFKRDDLLLDLLGLANLLTAAVASRLEG